MNFWVWLQIVWKCPRLIHYILLNNNMFLLSNATRYRKRLLKLWNRKGLFFITEQWLVDQVNNICKRGWLTKILLEEIERKIELDNDKRMILILRILLCKGQTLLP